MPTASLQVLYEDNHLLVVNKPSGLATMGAVVGRGSAVQAARDYLRMKYAKPGNVYVGVVSRLDAPASGVLVLARTSKAARRLTEQFRQGQVEKLYWAVVEGRPEPAADQCLDLIRKDERRQRMVIARPGDAGAQTARLSYRTLSCRGATSLLEVRLETGRKHQIRLQLAHRGHPIVGDKKYGAWTTFAAGIALHARQLSLIHPVRQSPLVIAAPPPAIWHRLGLQIPG